MGTIIMKNDKLRWGLFGAIVTAVLIWSMSTNSYPLAWVILILGLAVTSSKLSREFVLGPAYLLAFVSLSIVSIPTRFMLIGLAVASASVLAWRHFGKAPELKFWTALMLYLALSVATFSGTAGGAGGWAEWLIAIFQLEGATAEQLIWWVRKSLHFTVYGALAFSAFKALDSNQQPIPTSGKIAVIWSLSHACFDEFKQMSIPGRTGSPIDILIDLTGALVAVGIAVHLKRKGTP